MTTLGEIDFIHKRLEAIYLGRRNDLVRIAQSYGVSLADAEEAVHDAYIALCGLRPQAEILDLTTRWVEEPETITRLSNAITALFVYYLRLKCLGILRRNMQVTAGPLSDRGLQSVNPANDYVAAAALDKARRATERLRKEGTLDEWEWEYWVWRTENPGEPDQDFNRGLPAWTIARVKRRLFNKILAELEKMRHERESAARRNEQQLY